MYSSSALHGIIPPICTPLTAGGDVDTASLRRLVDYLIDAGMHGIFALGSTGEFALLTDAQQQTALETTVDAVRGRVPVLAGILDTGTRRSIENARHAMEAGADALVLAAPYYHPPSQREIIEHFRAVHAAVDVPLLAYDVPVTVKAKLEAETVLTLADEGTIIGLKDSSGSIEGFRRIVLETRDTTFRAFTGSELLVDSCLKMGAAGSVAGLANVFPAEYAALYDHASNDEWESAARLQERLIACFWELIGQGGGIYSATTSALGGFKTALKLKGVIADNYVAGPLRSFDAEEEERVADVLRRHDMLSA